MTTAPLEPDPQPAPGPGTSGEEPDRPVGVPVDHPDPPDDPPEGQRDDVPFRTPDPTEAGPGAGT